jgi:Mn2+/Fe2+ NRAMP family transporter
MGLLLTLITGLVVWVVLWAIGVKSFDAFLIPLVLVLIASTMRILVPFLPGRGGDEESGGGWTPR